MRNLTFRREDDRAAIGVGSLIIFIALILVAAVAAAVIIATVHSFQDRAEQRAREAANTVCGSFKVASIEGYRGGGATLNGTIDWLRVYVSTWDCPVDMNRTRIEIRTGSPPGSGGQYKLLSLATYIGPGPNFQINVARQLQLADYQHYAAEEVPGGVDNSGWDPWQSATHQPTYFLVPGNVLVLTIDLRGDGSAVDPEGIGGKLPPSTDATLKIVPSSGPEFVESFTTPSGYGTQSIVDLTNS